MTLTPNPERSRETAALRRALTDWRWHMQARGWITYQQADTGCVAIDHAWYVASYRMNIPERLYQRPATP